MVQLPPHPRSWGDKMQRHWICPELYMAYFTALTKVASSQSLFRVVNSVSVIQSTDGYWAPTTWRTRSWSFCRWCKGEQHTPPALEELTMWQEMWLPFCVSKEPNDHMCIHLVLTAYQRPWWDQFYLVPFELLLFVSLAGGLISITNRVFPWNI